MTLERRLPDQIAQARPCSALPSASTEAFQNCLDLYTRNPRWTPTVVIPAHLGPCPSGLTAGKKPGPPSSWGAPPSQDLQEKEGQELMGRSKTASASSRWEISQRKGQDLRKYCETRTKLLKPPPTSLGYSLSGHRPEHRT